jgi:hypothetical protein
MPRVSRRMLRQTRRKFIDSNSSKTTPEFELQTLVCAIIITGLLMLTIYLILSIQSPSISSKYQKHGGRSRFDDEYLYTKNSTHQLWYNTIIDFYLDFYNNEKKIYSQNGEGK